MSVFFPPFFNSNDYFIDEKVQLLRFHNHYQVFDGQGLQIGSIVQRVPTWQKLTRLILNKQMLPFRLDIMDANQQTIISIHRGWTFWMSKVTIADGHGNTLGYIRQKFKLLRPSFRIFDVTENEIGLITGDWKAWNFVIKNKEGKEIGTITKKWAGAMKEIFTSADKYRVSIVPEYAEDTNKINIVSAAIIIDMVMKER